jgi:hypothetical protein
MADDMSANGAAVRRRNPILINNIPSLIDFLEKLRQFLCEIWKCKCNAALFAII